MKPKKIPFHTTSLSALLDRQGTMNYQKRHTDAVKRHGKPKAAAAATGIAQPTLFAKMVCVLLALLLAVTSVPLIEPIPAFAQDGSAAEGPSLPGGDAGSALAGEVVYGDTAQPEGLGLDDLTPYSALAAGGALGASGAIAPLNYDAKSTYGTAEYWREVAGWSGTATKWTISNTTGQTLTNGSVYYLTGASTVKNTAAGGHGITVANNSTATIRFVGTSGNSLVATGGDGAWSTAGGTGIYIPSGSKLIVEGVGSITGYGGKAGTASSGSSGSSGEFNRSGLGNRGYQIGGKGGQGGSGAGAPGTGIGGKGGAGSAGGAGGPDTGQVATEGFDEYLRSGSAGTDASTGGTGSTMGALILKGTVTYSAAGGSGNTNVGSGGSGGSIATDAGSGFHNDYTAGGGGGGGGGGYSASSIAVGSGAGGGGGGGGGGGAGVWWQGSGTRTAPSGNGGGGGAGQGFGGAPGQRAYLNVYSGDTATSTDGGAGGPFVTTSRGGVSYRTGAGGKGGNMGSSGSVGSLSSYQNGTIITTNYGYSAPGTAPRDGKAAQRLRGYPVDECRVELTTAAHTTEEINDKVVPVYLYTGAEIKPAVRITHVPTNTVLSTTTTGYTVSYSSNTDPGSSQTELAKITITGAGFSSTKATLSDITNGTITGKGTLTAEFAIRYNLASYKTGWTGAAYSVTDTNGNVSDVVYKHTGGSVGASYLFFRDTSTTPATNRTIPSADYSIGYTNNINAGDNTALVEFRQNNTWKWTGGTTSRLVTYSIREAPTITSVGPFYDAEFNVPYAKQLEASGYNGNPDSRDKMTWSYTGSLPTGLTLNTATGMVSGTPTRKGTYTANITAKNRAGSHVRTFTWTVGDVMGVVYNDRNHNGVRDPGEVAIPGVRATVYRAGSSTQLATMVTDAQGYYGFAGLFPANTMVDIRFDSPDPLRFRVIGPVTETGIALNTNTTVTYKGFDIATTVTLNPGAHGNFATTPRTITGFQGDAMVIGKPDDLSVQDLWRLQGWYFDQQLTQPFDDICPVDDLTLYADYDQRVYSVHYTAPADAEQPDSKTLLLWEDADLLPDPQPYRPGYRLLGWIVPSDPDNYISSQQAYSSLVANVYVLSVTLDSVWELRHDIEVTLDANGSTGAPAYINGQPTETHSGLTYNDYLNYSPPIRDGYAFMGWSEFKNYRPETDPEPTMSLKVPGRDVTYYAVWEAKDVGVIFDETEGAFAPGEDGMRAGLPGDELTLPVKPERPGFVFKGWYTTPAGSDRIYAPEAEKGTFPGGKTYYFAQWEPVTVTLTLEAEGGTPETQTLVGKSASVVAYEFPTRDGHSFLGWDVEGDIEMFIPFPAQNTTYHAVWAVGRNTLAFNPMGGTFESGENGVRQGNTGDPYTAPADPTLDGYVFAGWYTTPEYLVPAPQDGVMPPESATYYAKWELADITAYLYSEGMLHDTVTGKYGAVIEYALPVKANASFVGWKLQGAPDATATAYPTFDSVDNRRYDAVFKDGAVSVIFNANGGMLEGDDGIRTGATGEIYDIPSAPQRAGYDFDGWFDAPIGGTRIFAAGDTQGVFATEANTVYYAQFRALEIEVVLDAGTDADPPVQRYSGAHQAEVPYSVPVRTGYAFQGWKEPGTLDSTAVKNLAFPEDDKAYVAVWTTEKVEVRFEAMGGTVVSGDTVQLGLPGATLTVPTLEYSGHAFAGWYDRPVGGALILGAAQQTALFSQSDATYYARWAPIEVSVTLDAGPGATPEFQAENGFFGQLIDYDLPVRPGSTFIGWKAQGADDSTATMSPTFPARSESTLVAVWAVGQVSVSYDPQGGEFPSGENGIRIGATGSGYTAPVDPQRAGYTFGGWFTSPGGGGSPYASTTYPAAANTVVYAHWAPIAIKVTLDANYAGSPAPETLQGSIGLAVHYTMPTRDGFAFQGWSMNQGATAAEATYFPAFGQSDETWYAVWAADAVTVRFLPVTGAFIGSESGIRSGSTGALYSVPGNPIRAGYEFAGWFTDVFDGEPVAGIGAYPSEDATYYAHWTAQDIEVTLDQNFEGAPDPETVTGIFSDKIDYAMPAREGYVFAGWSVAEDASTGDMHPTFPQETGQTLYASWEAQTVKVTYDAMGGEFADGSIAEHSGSPGEPYDIPVATRAGYAFKGWFTTPLGPVLAPGSGLLPTADKTYYAQWAPDTVDVTFQLGGGMVEGSGAPITLSGVEGDLVRWPTPERVGFEFLGWKLPMADDGTATRFLVFPNADTTYIGVWAALEDVTVLYDAYGGTLDSGGVYAGTPGTAYTAPGVAPREGFTFGGWALQPTDAYPDHNAGDERTFSQDNALTIYYAKWVADSYAVTLVFQDGMTADAEVEGEPGVAIDYEDLLPNRAGYIFKGWGDAPDSTAYDLFPRFEKERDGTTLYAQWDASGLMVSFFAQGDTASDAVIEGKVGETYSVPNDPERRGYAFAGWYSGKHASGVGLGRTAGDAVPFENGMIVAWYAAWTEVPITATLDAAGGTIDGQGSVSVSGSIDAAIPYELPERAGYAFIGWTADGGATTTISPLFPETSGTVFEAVWEAGDATLTFNPMGGSFAEGEDGVRSGKVDAGFTMPEAPTRTGHSFAGWFLDTSATKPAPGYLALPAASETLYAGWKPLSVTVQLSAIGSSIELQVLTGEYDDYIRYQEPQKAGSIFIGWRNAETGAVSKNPLYPAVDAVFEAVFSEGSVVAYFDPNGGTYLDSGAGVDSGIRSGEAGDERMAPPAEAVGRYGYAFTGWYTAPVGGSRVDVDGAFTLPTLSATYYAQWEPVVVAVVLDPQNGEGAKQVSGAYGTAIEYDLPRKPDHAFIGWATTPEDDLDDASPFPLFDASFAGETLYGQWQAGMASVFFFGMGAADASFLLEVGASFTVPADPVLMGATFEGWYDSPVDGTKQSFAAGDEVEADAAGSKAYYARWQTRTDITVTLDGGTGANPGTQTKVGTVGDEIPYDEPTREGYAFRGWKLRTDPAQADDAAQMAIRFPVEDATFDAVWRANDVTYAFDPNGGSAIPDNTRSGAADESFTLPDPPTRSGYAFAGWYTLAAGGALAYAADATTGVFGAASATYFAHWTPGEAVATLHGNGGAFEDGSTELAMAGKYGDLIEYEVPTQATFAFVGWATTPENNPVDATTTIYYGDTPQDYHAQWIQGQVSAVFRAEGGTFALPGETAFRTGIAGGEFTPPALEAREGYTFDGWYTQPDGGGTKLADPAVFSASGTDIYYANWLGDDIAVTLDGNGGRIQPDGTDTKDVTGKPGDIIDYGTTPARPGYTFMGWNEDATATAGQATPFFGTQDTTLYALWRAGAVTIDFQPMGGVATPGSSALTITDSVGSRYTVPTVERKGYVFKRWWFSPEGTASGPSMPGVPGAVLTLPNRDATYYAQWEEITYSISLNAGSGSFSDGASEKTVAGPQGAIIAALPAYEQPVRAGHTFMGWATDEAADQGNPYITVDADIAALYAVWKSDVVTVAYNPNGGSGGATLTSEAQATYPSIPSDTPTKPGYVFTGWFSDPVDPAAARHPQPVDGLYTVPDEDTVWYAQWQLAEVTLTLDAAGGTFASGDSTLAYTGDYRAAVAYEVPQRDGSIFKGWNVGGAVTRSLAFPAADATYRAEWEMVAQVNVTYDTQGGIAGAGITHTTGLPGSAYSASSIAVPAREGYRFGGWFAQPGGQGGPHPEPDGQGSFHYPQADTVWYAAWQKVDIDVVLDPAGGTIGGNSDPLEVAGEINAPIAYDIPVRQGYAFIGWNEDGTALSGSVFPVFTTALAGRTLYAIWEADATSATFFALGGTFAQDDDALHVGSVGGTYRVPADPQRTGYTFDGWCLDAALETPAHVKAGDAVAYSETEANVSYWARWTRDSITVTLDAQGGTVEGAKEKRVTGSYGEAIGYLLPQRAGYAFAGWSADKDALLGDMVLTFPEADATYYALWNAETIVLAFDGMEGTVTGGDTHTGTPDATYVVPGAIRAGYTFKGWATQPYTDAIDGPKAGTTAKMPAASGLYFAQWEENLIKATFNLNGGMVGSSPASIEKTGYAGERIFYDTPHKDKYVFTGWRLAGQSDASAELYLSYPAASTTYYAVWKKADLMYAYYYGMEGAVDGDAVYDSDASTRYTAPSATPQPGYLFLGWATSPESGIIDHRAKDVVTLGPSMRTNYYALYAPKANITVTCDPAGGTIDGSSAPKAYANLQFGEAVPYSIPQRDGFAFVGWSASQSTGDATMQLAAPAANTTYYAVWQERGVDTRHYAVYYGNGGEVDGDTLYSGAEGESYTAPNVKGREGYVFRGWAESARSSAISHNGGDAWAIGSAPRMSYYAQWDVKSDIVVRLDVNGGTWPDGSEDDEVLINQTYGASILAATPERPGYLFMGWSVDSGATMGNPNIIVPAQDATYYAAWMDVAAPAPTAYAFYDGNGGVVEGDTAFEGFAGSSYTAPAAKRGGYEFQGWSKAADGIIDHGSGDTRALPDEGSAKFYALWSRVDGITITLDPAGGTLAGAAVLTGLTSGETIVPEIPVRAGFLFTGWEPFDNSTEPSAAIIVGAGDKTYFANWVEVPGDETTSIVYYDGMGGTVEPAALLSGSIEDPYTAPTAVRDGYVFRGWAAAPGAAVDHDEFAECVFATEAHATFYALWSPRSDVDITCVLNNGEPDAFYPSQVAGSLFYPDAPVFADHIFLGWQKRGSGDQPSAAIVVPEANATYDAIWHEAAAPASLRVVLFDAQGGSLGAGAQPVLVGRVGGIYLLPTVEVRAGFSFEGWACDGVVYQAGEVHAYDAQPQKTYIAQWASKLVTVTLDAPDSSIGTQVLTGAYGAAIEYEQPYWAGNTFLGWKTAGSLDETAQRDLLFPQNDAAYEAVWKTSSDVSVTYDLAGGQDAQQSGAPIRLAGKHGQEYSMPTGISREGHDFAGWYEMPEGRGEKHADPLAGGKAVFPQSDAIWHAAWDAQQLTVTLDGNGGTFAGEPQVEVVGVIDAALSYELPVRDGFAFIGWGRTPDDLMGDLTPMFDLSLDGGTLYALWRVGKSSAAFIGNGGTPDTVTLGDVGESYFVPADPVREGHRFLGWFDSPIGGKRHAIRDRDVLIYTAAANTAYFAQWEAHDIVVTLDGNGGTIADAVKHGKFGEAVLYDEPLREGYAFRGWASDKGAATGQMSIAFPQESATYYAIWQVKNVVVTFDATGGTIAGQSEFSGTYGSAYAPPANPVRSGYSFRGWSTKVAGAVDQAVGIFPARNIVYYAVWDSNAVVVTPVNGSQTRTITSGSAVTSSGMGGSGGTMSSGPGAARSKDGNDGDALKRLKGLYQYKLAVSMVGGSIHILNSADSYDKKFLFVPERGYRLQSVTIDGREVEVDASTYTFANLTGEHDLDARFVLDSASPVSDFEMAARYNPLMWLIPAAVVVAIGGLAGWALYRAFRRRKTVDAESAKAE